MPPTLSQVLASGGNNSFSSLANVAIGFLAICAGVLTLVKGFELYRRRSLPTVVTAGEPSPLEVQNNERIEKLSFMVNELTREKELLIKQNSELKEQLSKLDEQKRFIDALQKSNQSLVKECERLRKEKEALILQNSPPLIKVKKQRTITGVKRKPKRVSPKGK